MCEELFGGELEVTVEPDYSQISDARRQKDYLYGTFQMQIKCISRIEKIVQKMD